MIKSALVVALVMVAGISVRPARAVELSLCPEPKAPPDRAREQRYLDPDGDVRVLSVSSLRADGACVRVELPVAQDAVRWLGLARAPSLPGRIDLHSRGQRRDLENNQDN